MPELTSRVYTVVAPIILVFLLIPQISAAQSPPQLSAAASASGGSPDATFYGGARIDEGPYLDSVERSSEFQLEIQIDPVTEAIGSSGKIYILAVSAGPAFTLLENGQWSVFDGTIEGLGGARSISSYDENNAFTVNNVADLFVQDGVPVINGEVALSIFVGYDSSVLSGDVHYTSAPLQLTLVDSGLQRDALLPELPNPSTLTGSPTSARFFGGASLAGTNNFTNPIFENTAAVNVTLEFMPELQHFDEPGNVFVLAIAGGVPFVFSDASDWVAWDGSVENLLANPAESYPELLSYHQLDADSVTGLLNEQGVQVQDNSIAFQVFIAYGTGAAPGQLFYSGAPLQFTVTIPSFRDEALEFYQGNISEQIVQAKCIACHVEGGFARTTSLIFQRPGPASVLNNFAMFETYLGSREDALDWLLTKASGGESHAGGIQLAPGSTDYNNLAAFLDSLLTGINDTPAPLFQLFFEGVGFQSNVETLRRAAIMLTGRAPSQNEIDAVKNGDEETLKSTLRNLMQGDGFHEFLVNGANDRLLVRGTAGGVAGGEGVFPNNANRQVDIQLEDLDAGIDGISFKLGRYWESIERGLRESPLELIAHVVENDKPYSEILTADYMMLNPLANFAVDGTAQFNNLDDQSEFQPGRMDQYVLNDGTVQFEFIEEIQEYRTLDGGFMVDYPHAGILNTQAWLNRYPTTPTNRNRARARWTFMNFLDIDIEASAQRTTDPVALADTNNPTLNNPACTVCHSIMDPVAGAYQNYFDQSGYRSEVPGTDSLDPNYKYSGLTDYQIGDTWYRDMRIPGIFGDEAPDPENSLQWLAQQIVQETGFARAAVKFWWPSVIGNKPLGLPEVEEDASYEAHLMAYDAQNKSIQELTEVFQASGMNVKDLLVEMILSPWFRASSLDPNGLSSRQLSAQDIAALGNETLLTPERLMRKTRALTGFGWMNWYHFSDDRITSGLSDNYGLYYGGIDSLAITDRATEMTPLMSTVAMTHALQSACPIVLKDFIYPSEQRRLFYNIDHLTTPLNGESIIRQKLVDLHFVLLGKEYSTDAIEIEATFQLLKDSWQERKASGREGNIARYSDEACSWDSDSFFLDDLQIDGEYIDVTYDAQGYPSFNYKGEAYDFLDQQGDDPEHMKGAWVTVIAYLLSNYHYLYE